MKKNYRVPTAKVLAHSYNFHTGDVIATLEWTGPRVILPEINTHRSLGKNSSSSRAIPIAKMMDAVRHDPYFPVYWGRNEKGMQAHAELTEEERKKALGAIEELRWHALATVEKLSQIGLHKQDANRYLEPWAWTTQIVTATNWDALFIQRAHADAQPAFKMLAYAALEALNASTPVVKRLPINSGQAEIVEDIGAWHMPYADQVADDFMDLLKKAIGCAARVSYLTHDGKHDPQANLDLFYRLAGGSPPHFSPFEHQARCASRSERFGAMQGWKTSRWFLEQDLGMPREPRLRRWYLDHKTDGGGNATYDLKSIDPIDEPPRQVDIQTTRWGRPLKGVA